MKLPWYFLRTRPEGERLRKLKGTGLFKELTAHELHELDELLHERSYQKDEVIFEEGDAGLGLFVIADGRVGIKSTHATLKRLAPEFGPGDFFGELALFEESKRTGTAVALEPTQILALFRNEFLSLLERDRRIGAKILYELSRTVVARSRRLLASEAHLPTL